MPVQSQPDIDTHTIIRVVSGPLHCPDIIEAVENSLRMPAFNRDMNAIWNICEAEVGHITAADMFEIIEYMQATMDRRGSDYKVAIVAEKDISFGIARMFALYCSKLPISVTVFRNMQQAQEWINPDS